MNRKPRRSPSRKAFRGNTPTPKSRKRKQIFSRGLNWFVPIEKKVMCYDCDKRELTLVFNQESDRYEGKRICRVCVQSFKRLSGSFAA